MPAILLAQSEQPAQASLTPIDVRYSNAVRLNYLFGSEFVDGSIRWNFTSGDAIAHLEARADTVWNDGSFRVGAGSIEVGRDLVLEGAAGFMETRNPSGIAGHTRGVIPHIEFNDDGTLQLHTPILNVEEFFDIYTTEVSETVGTTIGISLGVSPGRFLEKSIHEVGTVGSSADVTVSVYNGTDNTGFLKNRRVLPATGPKSMVAGTTLELDYDNDLGFRAGEANFMEFTSAANISLKTDSGSNPLTRHEAHELAELEVVTNNVMRNSAGQVMINLDNEAMFARQFR